MNFWLPVTVFNLLIAVFLTAVKMGGHGFVENLIWSMCIGLAIALLIRLGFRFVPWGPKRWLVVAVVVPVGALIGIGVAAAITGYDASLPGATLQALVIGLFFGAIASVMLFLRERNLRLAADLETRERARVEAEKRGIEAQLRMLQAQIEPHFLFNSLANLDGLIATDPALARRLLDALIRYLRASLSRTRAAHGSLGDEIALLTAYLDVQKIRMGGRLGYAFDVAEELRTLPLPPMLLQPLVENAIRHGLEPKIEGGAVTISARREGDALLLTVADNGLGFGSSLPAVGEGIGLENIRARLQALFGERGRLGVSAKVGAGTTAVVEIPA